MDKNSRIGSKPPLVNCVLHSKHTGLLPSTDMPWNLSFDDFAFAITSSQTPFLMSLIQPLELFSTFRTQAVLVKKI